MSTTVTASDGTALPLDSLSTALVFSGAFISTITVQYVANSTGVLSYFTQTFTNNGTNITAISNWVLGSPV
jgi:hypothetical protein